MSATRTLKRRIAIKYADRVAIIRAAYKTEEYLKHRSHQKRLARELREESQEQEAQTNVN